MSSPTEVTALPGGKIMIETSRLILRGAEDADVDGLYECFSDGSTMKYWSSLPHQDKDVTVQWVNKMKASDRNGVSDFAIILKSDHLHQCIGKVGVWDGNEIGFMIARKHWKQGLANEAITAVLDYFFGLYASDPKVTQCLISVFGTPDQWPSDVTADVDPRNEASLKALAKLGFEVYATKEKTLQVGDEWVDSVYLSLKKEAWLETRKAASV